MMKLLTSLIPNAVLTNSNRFYKILGITEYFSAFEVKFKSRRKWVQMKKRNSESISYLTYNVTFLTKAGKELAKSDIGEKEEI